MMVCTTKFVDTKKNVDRGSCVVKNCFDSENSAIRARNFAEFDLRIYFERKLCGQIYIVKDSDWLTL